MKISTEIPKPTNNGMSNGRLIKIPITNNVKKKALSILDTRANFLIIGHLLSERIFFFFCCFFVI